MEQSNFNYVTHEDCYHLLKRIHDYDYIITSPPDMDEIGFDTSEDGILQYKIFLFDRFAWFRPKNNVVTIINRNRKANGTVIAKDEIMRMAMRPHGWELKSQKIWVRSYKANLYRFNYSFIQTFKKGKCKAEKEAKLPDAFFNAVEPYEGYKDNFPPELIDDFIEVYCPKDGIVMDPFMGSGSTAIAALMAERKYLGAEINENVWQLAKQRIRLTSLLD